MVSTERGPQTREGWVKSHFLALNGNILTTVGDTAIGLIRLSSVKSRQHSIDYMGDGFYRSKDLTNIKVLKEHIVHRQIKHTIRRHINTYKQEIRPK